MTWNVSDFQRSDKSISISGPLRLEVDYDDVNTCAVDILIPILLKTLNEHFEVPVGGHCTNEDCEESWNEIHLDGDTCPQCGSVLEKGPVES